MDATPFIERILEDEGISSGLDDREASLMIESLTERAEKIAHGTNDATSARQRVETLCRQARRIARVVECFRDEGESEARAKAEQSAMHWPDETQDSVSLLRALLAEL